MTVALLITSVVIASISTACNMVTAKQPTTYSCSPIFFSFKVSTHHMFISRDFLDLPQAGLPPSSVLSCPLSRFVAVFPLFFGPPAGSFPVTGVVIDMLLTIPLEHQSFFI